MRKCPFCKAQIEETAKFCIFCMTAFDEKQEIKTINTKNKRWWKFLAAFLAFVLILVIVFVSAILYNPDTPANKNIHSNETNQISTTKKASLIIATDKSGNTYYIPKDESEKTSTINDKQNIKKPTKPNKTQRTNKTESLTVHKELTTTVSVSSKTTNMQTTNSVTNNVTYIYRDARRGDDFSVSYPIDNCVVITDVTTPSKNGEYIIPQKLGGKTVIAIMGGAFCNDNIKNTVKTVVVPSTVKTIWNYAFANCYNLTDIYFSSNSIYTEAAAFAEKSKRKGALTIHCSLNCSDRNFRYYKNSASDYDALFKEWNN